MWQRGMNSCGITVTRLCADGGQRCCVSVLLCVASVYYYALLYTQTRMSYVRVLCTLLIGVGAPQPRPSPLPYPDPLYVDAMDDPGPLYVDPSHAYPSHAYNAITEGVGDYIPDGAGDIRDVYGQTRLLGRVQAVQAKSQSLLERLESLLGRPKWVSPQTADAAEAVEAATDTIFWMAEGASRTEAA